MSQRLGVGSLSNLRVLSVLLAGTMVLTACSREASNPVAPGIGTGVVNAEHESPSTAASSAASSALEGSDLCHRTSGTNAFVLITVPASAVDARLAQGDARPGSPVPGQPDMILSPNCTPVSTSPVTITFDGLSNNGSPFKSYSQGGFTVSPTSGSWTALTTYGNPLPSIIFNRSAAQPTITAAVTITAGGSGFRFQSVDLYSSITTIPYVFTGRLKSNQVFSISGEEGNTFGSFVTVANPNATDTIDTLVITLSNPETPCCPNPVGLDNIVVVYQP